MDEKVILLLIVVVSVFMFLYFGLVYEPIQEEINYTEQRRLMLEERNRTQWEDRQFAREHMNEEYLVNQLKIIYEKK